MAEAAGGARAVSELRLEPYPDQPQTPVLGIAIEPSEKPLPRLADAALPLPDQSRLHVRIGCPRSERPRSGCVAQRLTRVAACRGRFARVELPLRNEGKRDDDREQPCGGGDGRTNPSRR